MRRPRSFSLLEVMLATVILLVIICAVLLAYSQSMLLNQASRNLALAANDCQRVLEEIKALSYGDIPGYAPPALANLSGEVISLSRGVETNITTVTVNVQWQEGGMARNLAFTSCFAKK